MSASAVDLAIIDELTAGKIGVYDAACPLCGPARRKLANQQKRALRIWRLDPGFASFHCARCGERGYVHDGAAIAPDPAVIQRARAEAGERGRIASADRLSKARWLWSKRRPLASSIAENYLREARGYAGPLHSTLGFLPARGQYQPAIVAAFGFPTEPEPGLLVIADNAVHGVHLTRLAPGGSGKAGTDADKIMIGASLGSPIALAPVNDLLGLAICEGVEDALSVYEATGLGAWAAGSASRLPALAGAIPSYVESVTVLVDDDDAGRVHARELAARLDRRNIDVRLVSLGGFWKAA